MGSGLAGKTSIELLISIGGCVRSQPRLKLIKVKPSGLVKAIDKCKRRIRIRRQGHAVGSQECVHYRERHSLVAVHKWMVLRQALPQGSRFRDEVLIIAGLGPEERGFKEAQIADTG